MKKTNKIITAVLILSAIILLEIVWILHQEKNGDTPHKQAETEALQTQGEPTGTLEVTIPEVTDQQIAETPATEQTDPTVTEPEATVPKTTKPQESTQNDRPPQIQPPQTQPPQTQQPPIVPVQTEPTVPDNTCHFPYAIPGSTLVIEQINSYDGIFFEDGSDREMTNITAMVLTNRGDNCVEYVDIAIEREGTQLKFAASAIEAGGTVVVMEAEGKQYAEGDYANCTAEVATIAEMIMSQDQISVEENPEGGLLVTNLTEEEIPCVRIFYKFYMQEVDVYVGGITYTAKIDNLAAKSSCTVMPSHYLQGFSKIVMVKTYDSDE